MQGVKETVERGRECERNREKVSKPERCVWWCVVKERGRIGCVEREGERAGRKLCGAVCDGGEGVR